MLLPRTELDKTASYRSWTQRMSTIFNCIYLPNRSTLDIGVLGFFGIVSPKEHPPEVWSVLPATPRIRLRAAIRLQGQFFNGIPEVQ
jgi:hypothetical protein